MNVQEEFQEQGYVSAVPVLSSRQTGQFIKRLKNCPPPQAWHKSMAAHYSAYAMAAQEPRIVNVVKQLIGENIILWGASLVRRPPGVEHAWHSDVETAYATGKTVSVWIGLDNVNDRSGLRLISASHQFGSSIQELQYLNNLQRCDTSTRRILQWAKQYNPASEIRQPVLRVGEAIFFDGRIWHSSVNRTLFATRTVLLLQYASPEVPIRVCTSMDTSPYIRAAEPGPPCILVSGRDTFGVNTIVSTRRTDAKMRPAAKTPFLSTVVKHEDLPLKGNPDTGWQYYPLGAGVTPTVNHMTFHMSVLNPGMMPHEPHNHRDEELLIMLSGEAELVMIPEDLTGKHQRHRLKAGQLVYYPAFYRHTIHNTSREPITYLMFKWYASLPSHNESAASVHQYAHADLSVDNTHDRPFQTRTLFDLPTRHLKKLHCHVSLLQPGAGYASHRDPYDVAIVLLKGVVESVGRKIEPFSVIYYSAGELHGMKNIGNDPAYYLVFEFHPGGPPRRPWLRAALQLGRILKSPVTQIPRNLGVCLAVNLQIARQRLARRFTS